MAELRDPRPVVVLKFGSSVLRDEQALPAAVAEIYREVRRDRRVIAVVSAFGATTDTLLQDARRLCDRPDPHALARLLETGEARAAATLGLALAEVGLAAEILDHRRLDLRTTGPVLDATPARLDNAALRAFLAATPVVVVPGFCGLDASGRTTLLGRGGSDLTALFLAREAGAAECRLLKDVDGLLQVADDGTLDHTTRYATAHYDECLRVGGPLVQPKAVEFAARHGLTFGIARCGSAGGTLAGPLPSRFETVSARPPRLRVALAGLGTVGLGVARWLQRLDQDFELVRVLVSDTGRPRPADIPRRLLTDRWADLLEPRPDLLVEAIGGTDTAAALLGAATLRGIPVVSANKQALALDAELRALAARGDAPGLRASASVGGGMPALEHATLVAAGEPVTALAGILNGTCNFVLERMAGGAAYGEAVAEAQALGLAEADPYLDVSGLDAAYKLSLLATAAFGTPVAPDAIACRGLDRLSRTRLERALQVGRQPRLVAEARLRGGRVEARVGVRDLPADHPLAGCRGEANRLVLTTAGGRRHVVDGLGAGRWPTTCAVVADLLALRRERLAGRATDRNAARVQDAGA